MSSEKYVCKDEFDRFLYAKASIMRAPMWKEYLRFLVESEGKRHFCDNLSFRKDTLSFAEQERLLRLFFANDENEWIDCMAASELRNMLFRNMFHDSSENISKFEFINEAVQYMGKYFEQEIKKLTDYYEFKNDEDRLEGIRMAREEDAHFFDELPIAV